MSKPTRSRTTHLQYGDDTPGSGRSGSAIQIEEDDDAYTVDTGAALFRIGKRTFELFQEVRLADGTVIVARSDSAQTRYGAVVRGLKSMVTRAIPDPANKGHSYLVYAACSPQAEREDYTLRFTSPREYEVKGAKSGHVGNGGYLQDFASADGLVSIPGAAWMPYALPETGDIYRFWHDPGWPCRQPVRMCGRPRLWSAARCGASSS